MGTKENITKMNEMILQGNMMDAFEKYYDEKVVMQENNQKPREGKSTNREYEKKFIENVKEFHSAKVKSVAIGKCEESGNDLSTVEWTMDVSFKDGKRMKMAQVAIQRWKGDKIVKENFYYDTAK